MSAIDQPTPAQGYIQLELMLDVDSLTLTGIGYMEDCYEGWERNPANPDTVMIEGAGQIAGEVYEQASAMPPEAMVKILTSIYQIPMLEGTPATAMATFTFDDQAMAGMIDFGSYVAVPHPSGENVMFTTVDDINIAPNTVVNCPLAADAVGTAGNGAFGLSELIEPVEGLDSIVVSESAGGTDDETAMEFLDRGSTILSTGERRPVLPEDHAVFVAANVPGIKRATAINLLVPGTVDTPLAIRDPNEVNYFVDIGGVPTVDTYDTPRCTTVAIVPEQEGLSPEGLQDLMQTAWEYLDANREINFLNYVIPPEYVDIEVRGEVHPWPNFTGEDAAQAAEAMIANWLDPNLFGTSPGATTGKEWINDTVLRHDEAVDYANRAGGVWWTRNIEMRFAGGAWTAGDLQMTGLAPLPRLTACDFTPV